MEIQSEPSQKLGRVAQYGPQSPQIGRDVVGAGLAYSSEITKIDHFFPDSMITFIQNG